MSEFERAIAALREVQREGDVRSEPADRALQEAVVALREQTYEPPGEQGIERLTHAIDRHAFAMRARRRGRALRFSMVLAATLTVGVALAHQKGWLAKAVQDPTASLPPVAGSTVAPNHVQSAGDATLADLPPGPPEERPVAPEHTVQNAPVSQPSVPSKPQAPPAPRPSAGRTERTEKASAAPEVDDAKGAQAPTTLAPMDLDALYRQAHVAQFQTREPKRALGLWDAYLQAADPSAKLLLEARFNRALVLRDLGQKAAAKAALTPFADGDYGDFRKAEARALIDALEK